MSGWLDLHRSKIRGCVLAVVGLLSGTVAAQAVTEFSDGITPGALPLGIVAGSDGNLWFAESGLDRIARMTPAGVVTEFSAGITPGSQPSEITRGADGNLWFTEQGGRVGRITPQGIVTEFDAGIPSGTLDDIAAGPDGNVWFTKPSYVGRITPEGVVTKFGPIVSIGIGHITAGADGNLWYTYKPVGPSILPYRVTWIAQSGQIGPAGSVATFQQPGVLTSGPDGNLWLTSPNTGAAVDGLDIKQVTLAGTVTSYPAGSTPDTVVFDSGITTGPDGNLWFTNQAPLPAGDVELSRDSIGRITPAGAVTNFAFGSPATPGDITEGPDGNLWFTYRDGGRIGRITPSGELTDFTAGLDPSQFAIDIAAGPDGNLWFTLSQGPTPGAQIGRITPAGAITTFTIAPDFTQISDIVAGPDGNLWLADQGHTAIKRVTLTGEVTNFDVGTTADASPGDIAAGPDGNLWFTEPALDRIGRITTAGVITEFSAGISAGARPGAIAAGADGNVWFTEAGDTAGSGTGIARITPSGVVTESVSPFGDGWQPMEIATGHDGNVWFAEQHLNLWRIGRISPDGEVTRFNSGYTALVHPRAIVAGPDGNIWFTDPNYVIGRISPDHILDTPSFPPFTDVITTFRTRTNGYPRRIAAGPDGNLWFTEFYGDRIGRITTSTTAIEFYNANLDHYFMTWMPDEIAKLDAGTEIKGWVRTGYAFKIYAIPQPASTPVCRYYIPPALGDSHFFGRDVAECNATAQKNPSFVLEDRAFMQMFLPAAGICPDSTTPVYRVFSNRLDANHRYMTDRALRDEMVAKGWLAEGDGPDLVVMCAPQ